MNSDTAVRGPQWQCFGCDLPTGVISDWLRGYPICPTCKVRRRDSAVFAADLAKRVRRADVAMLSAMMGITPALFEEAAQACGPDLDAFKAFVAARR